MRWLLAVELEAVAAADGAVARGASAAVGRVAVTAAAHVDILVAGGQVEGEAGRTGEVKRDLPAGGILDVDDAIRLASGRGRPGWLGGARPGGQGGRRREGGRISGNEDRDDHVLLDGAIAGGILIPTVVDGVIEIEPNAHTVRLTNLPAGQRYAGIY